MQGIKMVEDYLQSLNYFDAIELIEEKLLEKGINEKLVGKMAREIYKENYIDKH